MLNASQYKKDHVYIRDDWGYKSFWLNGEKLNPASLDGITVRWPDETEMYHRIVSESLSAYVDDMGHRNYITTTLFFAVVNFHRFEVRIPLDGLCVIATHPIE